MKLRLYGLPLLLLGAVILSACGYLQGEPAAEIDLPQTYEFPETGYSIGHLEGWTVSTRDTRTIINELEAEHVRAFISEVGFEGKVISFEYLPLRFLYVMGLQEDPTLEDFLEFNRDYFSWPESSQVTQTTVFDESALSVSYQQGEGSGMAVIGLVGEGGYLLTLTAPNEEALNEFMPTWNAILASGKAVDE